MKKVSITPKRYKPLKANFTLVESHPELEIYMIGK